MSEENVEIVRRVYDEIVDRPEATRQLYAPDFEMDLTDIAPDIGVVRGFDAMNEALRPYFESFEAFRVTIEDILYADEKWVIVAAFDDGQMHGSDSELRNHRFHAFHLRDGKIVRFSAHLDRERAFEAARLSE
ncbi:MAG: nuclear transport factor 2 family protein [Solirubrobacterales bacterium]